MSLTSISPKQAWNSTTTSRKQTTLTLSRRFLTASPELQRSGVPRTMEAQNIASLSPPPPPVRLTVPGVLRKRILLTRPI